MTETLRAKPNYTKEVGQKTCVECHDRANIKGPSDKEPYRASVEMRQKMKAQKGKYKNKTTCYDCHEGDSLEDS